MINLRWPAKRGNSLNPWYTIAWRMIWWLPLIACLALTAILVGIVMFDWREAVDFWERAK